MPRVSVIIPTYNRRQFLVDAVESVLGQTYRDFELVVVDDGSQDGTAEAMAAYGRRLIYYGKSHGGVSSARNVGLQISSGSLVAFLDSDDLWLREKLAVQVEFLDRNPMAELCYTDEIWIRNGVRVNPGKRHAKYSGWIFERCLPLCIISPSSVMIRRRLFDEVGLFDESLPICEDYDLWLRISLRHPIQFIPRRLIIKRGGHPDQLSRSCWGNDRFRVRAMQKILESPFLDDHRRLAVLREIETKCRILAHGFKKRGKLEEFHYYNELPKRLKEARPV